MHQKHYSQIKQTFVTLEALLLDYNQIREILGRFLNWIKWTPKDFHFHKSLSYWKHNIKQINNKCLSWEILTILSTKLAHFKFDAFYRSQNSWAGQCLPWCRHLIKFSKQFVDAGASRLWVSGDLVMEFGPILAWYMFKAAEAFVVIFDVFFIYWCSNVLYR